MPATRSIKINRLLERLTGFREKIGLARGPAASKLLARLGVCALAALIATGGVFWASRAWAPPHAPALLAGSSNDDIDKAVASVLDETKTVWTDVLKKQKGVAYTPPHLVFYDTYIKSACGRTYAGMGPIYCPVDDKIYLDPTFFIYMRARFGGGGDFAYAYILAHEIGHRVQDQIGILGKARVEQRSAFGALGNAISVRIELMADCYAGIWAANAETKHVIDNADVEKLVATAKAIGDDSLQKAALGRIVADTFTHGTSDQRAHWFATGLKSGKIDACNTFAR
ncbi:MAG TPA: neutral zinc metallopeptidase [Methylovirgula sp.]|jgi:hypothetical protein